MRPGMHRRERRPGKHRRLTKRVILLATLAAALAAAIGFGVFDDYRAEPLDVVWTSISGH